MSRDTGRSPSQSATGRKSVHRAATPFGLEWVSTHLFVQAWIGRFGRTVAEQVLEAVEDRMRAAPAPAPGVEIALAGERIGWSADGGEEDLACRDEEEEARRKADWFAAWLKGETAGSRSPDPGEDRRWPGLVLPRARLLRFVRLEPETGVG